MYRAVRVVFSEFLRIDTAPAAAEGAHFIAGILRRKLQGFI
jgi:hypothetical protein